MALALALAAIGGSAKSVLADVPVVLQTYTVVPTSVFISQPSIYTPLPMFLEPPSIVRYESIPGPVLPTVAWWPGVTYVQTTQWLPVVSPCTTTIVETPLIASDTQGPAVVSSPQSQSVEELPADTPASQPAAEPAEEDSREPELKHGGTPPGLPDPAKKTDDAASGTATQPKSEEKADLSKDDDIPPNTPVPGATGRTPNEQQPAAATPSPKKEESAPAAANPAPSQGETKSANPGASPAGTDTKQPAAKKDESFPSEIPLPDGAMTKTDTAKEPATKLNPVKEVPASNSATEKKDDSLITPGTSAIPLPESPAPELAPVTPADTGVVKPGGAAGAGAKTEDSKPAADGGANASKPIELPEIPPPAEELPPAAAPRNDSSRPVIPLPELPLPEDLPPAIESRDTSKKPLDPQALKAGGSNTQETSAKRFEAQRPVIESKPVGEGSDKTADLEIQVRSSVATGSINGVPVRFRRTATGQSFETVSDAAGKARAKVPDGVWEVEIESSTGQRFVLGDVISKDGRVTTSSGRDLPRLEITR
jgi:hypothetical protein